MVHLLLYIGLGHQFDGLFLDANFIACWQLVYTLSRTFALTGCDLIDGGKRLCPLIDTWVPSLENALLIHFVDRVKFDAIGVEASLTRLLLFLFFWLLVRIIRRRLGFSILILFLLLVKNGLQTLSIGHFFLRHLVALLLDCGKA
jgi:hypothetical protein